jgi:hypothetical protein
MKVQWERSFFIIKQYICNESEESNRPTTQIEKSTPVYVNVLHVMYIVGYCYKFVA